MPRSTRTLSDRFLLIIKGLAMGTANKVPGVSGGVVAFVAGFYEEFIHSLQQLNTKSLRLLLNFKFQLFFNYINGRFLGLLILGMVISYFSVSKLLDYLIINYELYVWSCFFGMIIGSIYYIVNDFTEWSRKNIGFILLGTLVGIAISLLEPARENDNLWFVFLCGIIGVSGMTLPGLSGSFILILLGNYVLLLVDSVNALFDVITMSLQGDFSFIANSVTIRLLKVLVIFSFGSVVGLVSLSHILGYVLKHFKNATFALIIGFITGSLGVVWPWKNKVFKTDNIGNRLLDSHGNKILESYNRFFPDPTNTETHIAIFYIIFGISIVLGLELYGKMRQTTK